GVVPGALGGGQRLGVDDGRAPRGAVAAVAGVRGFRPGVAAPVVVDASLWGTIIAATSEEEPLPAATESRLGQFTGLVATAIANAQARGELSRLAEEQAGLRRGATLVAQQPSSEQNFGAGGAAIRSLLGAGRASVVVFPDDTTGTVVAIWSREGPTLPVGTSVPLDSDTAVARIFHSGAAARMDSYAEGAAAELARTLGVRSTVGAPIHVE